MSMYNRTKIEVFHLNRHADRRDDAARLRARRIGDVGGQRWGLQGRHAQRGGRGHIALLRPQTISGQSWSTTKAIGKP